MPASLELSRTAQHCMREQALRSHCLPPPAPSSGPPFTPPPLPPPNPLQRPPSKACGSLVGNATQLHYSTGAKNICTCGPDPFLKGSVKGASWILCKCPNASWPRNNTLGIPTTATYTNWPTADMASPPQPSWPRCSGKYALCSSANCTLVSEWGREGGNMEGGREAGACPACQAAMRAAVAQALILPLHFFPAPHTTTAHSSTTLPCSAPHCPALATWRRPSRARSRALYSWLSAAASSPQAPMAWE
jgi:hypothetical protein